jgi:hypothetical protein
VSADKPGVLLALNSISNTISAIPLTDKPWVADQYTALNNYRTAMLEAYIDLLGALVQYLKDGFCDLLLLKCRTCDEQDDQPVYLAGITIKNGRVYKVCNFTQRRYVKTFPGVEYWFSVIPILPEVELAIREFCCLTFTDLFRQITVAQNSGTNFVNVPSASVAYSTVNTLKTINLTSFTTALNTRLTPVGGITADYLKKLFTLTPAAPSVPATSVNGQPAAQGQRLLAQQGSLVTVLPYDPSKVAANLVRTVAAPAQIPAGSAVNLYTDASGNVKSFEIASPQVQNLQAHVVAVEEAQTVAQTILSATPGIETDVASLKVQLTNLQVTSQAALATRDAQIAQLTASTQTLQTSLTAAQTANQAALATRDTQIATLTASLNEVKIQVTKLTPPTPPAKG